MKNLKITLTLAVAVMAATLLTTTAYAWCGGMGGGYGGMGGHYGSYGTTSTYPTQPSPTAPTTQYYQPVYPFHFGGCMGAFGWNGGYGYGYNTAPYTYTGENIDIATAASIGENYVAALGNPDLAVKEVEEYSANFYIQVYEKSTGTGAFELLVNKYTGSIYPEMGPNMMWNTKYGMMRSGILGGIFGTPTTTMALTQTQAEENAQEFLDAYYPRTTVGEATPFYGYYHVMVESAGAPYGMLSVNGYTGQVWFHNWHGIFIQELQVS